MIDAWGAVSAAEGAAGRSSMWGGMQPDGRLSMATGPTLPMAGAAAAARRAFAGEPETVQLADPRE